MTRYDDLKPLVESWRAASSALYRDAQILPAAVAQRMRLYLGCAERAVDPDGLSHALVAPCIARWEGPAPDGRFTLTPYDLPPDWTAYVDGRFYFGLRVLLEGAQVWQKDPFWIVLSALREGADFVVRDENNGADFRLRVEESDSLDRLCAHLHAAIRRELSSPPHLRAQRAPIGFGLTPG